MNGITVPDSYKHMVKRERNSREYNDAIIRDYINANPDKVLTSQDFIDAMDGLTTAPQHVARLRKSGRIIRTSVKNGQRGYAFKYKWVNGGSVAPTASGDVVVTKPRTAFATDYELKRLDAWFLEYTKQIIGEHVVGASAFRAWVYRQQQQSMEVKPDESNDK